MKYIARLGMVCVAAWSVSAPAWADLKLGVFPRFPAQDAVQAFKPLAEYLAAQLGEKVELIPGKDFPSFWEAVEGKQFDVVYYNQYHYVLSHDSLGYKAIVANIEDGSKQIAGGLFARSDSGINTVADIKGKTIIFAGDEKAMGSYIAQTALLRKAGLVEGKDYTAKFAKNPPSTFMAVFNKQADVAGAGNVVLNSPPVKKAIDVTQMKSIAESEPFVHLTWAVSAAVDETKAKKIQTAMAGLDAKNPEHAAILKAARVDGFYPVTEKDYEKVREMVKQATDK